MKKSHILLAVGGIALALVLYLVMIKVVWVTAAFVSGALCTWVMMKMNQLLKWRKAWTAGNQ